jgi:glycosidase
MTAFDLPPFKGKQILDHLSFLYGEQVSGSLLDRLRDLVQSYFPVIQRPESSELTEKDIVLITYADQLTSPEEPPLKTLEAFLSEYLTDLVTTIHILPFYPYSSDDGFSVIDYRQVNPAFGDWSHIQEIRHEFKLMFDAVINHISAKSDWFQGFLRNEPPYNEYFITVDPETDLSSIVRPRDLPLLTSFQTSQGERHLWTTFSTDQIDLNFANPEVLMEILDLLLYYIKQGASIIRLDAIAFLWKEIGSTSIHLPQTHRIIKIMRAIVDHIAPHVLLLTETNVPHEENISYFGTGEDEAHMVYQFALPPLILHTLVAGDASRLSNWAATLDRPSEEVTFFNFTASHDGIGVRPARNILTEEEVETLIERVEDHGGGISYRRIGDHERQAYELNINYFDALNSADEIQHDLQRTVDRFLCSQAIMLAFPGLPAIYFHSLFGSRNDREGVERTGHLRSINRQNFSRSSFEAELRRPGTRRNLIFQGYQRLLRARGGHAAFSPWGKYEVLPIDSKIFAMLRYASQESSKVLCLHEIAGEPFEFNGTLETGLPCAGEDLFTGEKIHIDRLTLQPYQVCWIQLE